MALHRRALLQGATAVPVLGAAGAALLTGAQSADAATASTASTAGAASLVLDKAAWHHDDTNDVYWQIGVTYVATPAAADYETLGVYVPGAYLTATANGDGTYTAVVDRTGAVGGLTARTAPVVMPVNTPGYSAQKPPTEYAYDSAAAYLEAGFVYVHAGLRGRDSNTDAYTGNAPWGVTDLKAAVRYLRYNARLLPGDTDAVFVFGHSGGGAQSAVAGASGDSALYTPYLKALGAAMTGPTGAKLSDAVAGAMCWCPITSLDRADAAYEWNMGQFATTGTRAAGTWTEAYSKDLAAAYATYVNRLGLRRGRRTLRLEPTAEGVHLAGGYYDHVVEVVTTSLNHFLADTTFPYTPTSSQQPGMDGPGGTSTATATTASTTYATAQDYVDSLNAGTTWVNYDAATNTATITGLADFVTSQKNASKDVGAFDAPDRSATENVVFGAGADGLHFSEVAHQVVAAHGSTYAGLTGWDPDYAASAYAGDLATTDAVGTTMRHRVDMYNPMYYLCDFYAGQDTSSVAPHWRIRTGIMQGDTASTVEINLALALERYGIDDVDFETVWAQGHTMAERSGDGEANFIDWVTGVVAG